MNSISVKYREFLEMIRNFFSKDAGIVLLASMIAGVVSHFYFFTHNVMAPDMVATGFYHISGEWEASLGRWGIHIIDELRNGIVNPFLIAFTFIMCASLAALFIIKIFDVRNRVVMVLIGVLLVVAPQLAETIMFTFTADAYGISLLFSCIGVYLISKENCKPWQYVIAGVIIVFSLGLYQAYIGFTVGLVCILFIKRILNETDIKKSIIWLVKNMIFILFCLITYYLATNIYLYLNGWELASYKGANSLGFGLILQLPTSIVNAYRDFYQFLFGESVIKNEIWNRDLLNIIFTIVLFLALIHHIYTKKIYKSPLRLVSLGFAIIIFPVAVNVMDLITPGTSINLVTGYGLLLFYVLVLIVVEDRIHLFLAPSVVTVGFLCLTFILSNNASYMAREEVYQNYYAESMRILSRVESVEGYSSEMKWMFSDNIQYISNFSEFGNGFISDDYMTWNSPGGIWNSQMFYKEFMGEEINMVTYEEHNRILGSEEFQNMGIYPAEDSIKIINDIVVIKLSETGTYVQ